MAEIEIGVLRGQCLDRRIGDKKKLVSEIAIWERERNSARAKVKWMFTTKKRGQRWAALILRPDAILKAAGNES